MRLKFASYNIHKAVGIDRRRDPERIISVLREIDADVIALQEADERFGERASVLPRALLDDTKWHAVSLAKRPRSIGWHGNALLVRRGIEVMEAEPLDLPTLEPRGAVRCDLQVEGCRVRVVGMHLDLSGMRRRAQVKSVLRHLDECEGDCPAVLLGDFNQWGVSSGAMREFAGWQPLETGRSFPSRRPLAQLDRILASKHWECGAAGAHHTALSSIASDHLPIWSELRMSSD